MTFLRRRLKSHAIVRHRFSLFFNSYDVFGVNKKNPPLQASYWNRRLKKLYRKFRPAEFSIFILP